jgi:hypothetical protein
MLTDAQLATLKADMQTNQAANLAAGNYRLVADYYNAPGTGLIWRPVITVEELNTAISWAEFAAVPVARQNTYLAMISPGFIDATSANIRAGFGTVFSAGGASNPQLTTLAQQTPTRLEQLFSTGNISAVFGYRCTVNDVMNALAQP